MILLTNVIPINNLKNENMCIQEKGEEERKSLGVQQPKNSELNSLPDLRPAIPSSREYFASPTTLGTELGRAGYFL